MTTTTTTSRPSHDDAHGDRVVRAWAALGVLFNCEPGDADPDLERLLLDTARVASENARLLPLVVTWLSLYSSFVARHRLKRLVVDELEPEFQPVLGLLLELAVEHGASRDLLLAADVCQPATVAGPLYSVERSHEAFARIAEQNASELSKKWGVWVPPIELKFDAVRPVRWLLDANPGYRSRVVRKGDLRVSILESLARDLPSGVAPSESALSRLAGATRAGVRKAMQSLLLEGAIVVGGDRVNDRDQPVALHKAA